MADGWPAPGVDNACVSWDSSLLPSALTFLPHTIRYSRAILSDDVIKLSKERSLAAWVDWRDFKCKLAASVWCQRVFITTHPQIYIHIPHGLTTRCRKRNICNFY